MAFNFVLLILFVVIAERDWLFVVIAERDWLFVVIAERDGSFVVIAERDGSFVVEPNIESWVPLRARPTYKKMAFFLVSQKPGFLKKPGFLTGLSKLNSHYPSPPSIDEPGRRTLWPVVLFPFEDFLWSWNLAGSWPKIKL
jgi:hypothetical protein